MYFDAFKSILFSDTLLPDIFISEYLPSMNSDNLKVYIYCLFLSKYNKHASTEDLSKKLGLSLDTVKDAITFLENEGLISRKSKSISFVDLKEKEINKLYRLKTTSSPDEAMSNSHKNKKRNKIISAINDKFFQGVMSPSWYTDIDAWFDRFKFDEDVMYTLFQHCYDHNGLAKNYILKVAENWHNKNITNSFDLDKYYLDYQKIKGIRSKIIKKLNLPRLLTEYEDDFLEKWVLTYGYEFDVIEIVLKKTTGKTNPSFNYINAVLTNWYNANLKTKNEIVEYLKKSGEIKQGNKKKSDNAPIPQHVNFEQRNYTQEDLNNFFVDVTKQDNLEKESS